MKQTERAKLRELRTSWEVKGAEWQHAERRVALHVRLTRCLSWLEHVDETELEGRESADSRLVFGWIALNALYGQWDLEQQRHADNSKSLRDFIGVICRADSSGEIDRVFVRSRELIRTIGRDEGLTREWWMTPSPDVPSGKHADGDHILDWYGQGHSSRALHRLLDRIYVARCQLVHGGSTCGSALNRGAVDSCADLLVPLVLAIASVIIRDCADESWPSPCYPPPRQRLADRGRAD